MTPQHPFYFPKPVFKRTGISRPKFSPRNYCSPNYTAHVGELTEIFLTFQVQIIFWGRELKTIIAYGTRFGATAETAEEIAKVFREEGFDVKVANVKEEKIQDISDYGLVVVGSGMAMDNWTGEAEDFLKKRSRHRKSWRRTG
jgi:flavorubredoxin